MIWVDWPWHYVRILGQSARGESEISVKERCGKTHWKGNASFAMREGEGKRGFTQEKERERLLFSPDEHITKENPLSCKSTVVCALAHAFSGSGHKRCKHKLNK